MTKADPRRVIQRLVRRFTAAHDRRKRPENLDSQAALVRLPATHIDAVNRMSDVAAFNQTKAMKRIALKPDRFVHPDIVRFHASMMKQCKLRHFPLYGFEFHRTSERQEALYAL